jgi:photosystem II stability/assembly factor-like uncharacterized protein
MIFVTLLLFFPAIAQEHPPFVSGTWQSNIGLVYEIKCSGNTFNWRVASTGETAQGEVEGEILFASWRSRKGEQSARGAIVKVDDQGKALRIEWSNGVVFSRSFAASDVPHRASGQAREEAGRQSGSIPPRIKGQTAEVKEMRSSPSQQAGPRQDQGWCLLHTEIFPALAEDCENAGGRFFAKRAEAEEYFSREGAGPPAQREQENLPAQRIERPLEVTQIDISGPWFSNQGHRYMIEQHKLDFEMVNLDEGRAAAGHFKDERLVLSPEGDGYEIIGQILEVDGNGRAHLLEWSDGTVLAREPFPHTIIQSGSEPAGAEVADISGIWTSSIKRTYKITQHGRAFTWTVQGTDETSTGSLHGEEVVAEWTGTYGSGHAEGRITNRDASGKALRIEWSNGVFFTRMTDPGKTPAMGSDKPEIQMPAGVKTMKMVTISPATLQELVPHFSLKTVHDQWVKVGGPIGGLGYDVRYISNDPAGRNVMFVTDNYSGVNKSVDGGKNWFASNNGIDARFGVSGDAIPVFSLTVDPNNSNIIWAGLKDVIGVYKSTDGGMTWTKKTPHIREKEFVFRGFTIMPGDSNTVFAAGELPTGVQGKVFGKVKGRIYVTRDGGETWKKLWEGNDLVRYVIINAQNHDIIYASCGIFDREAFNSDCKSPALKSPTLSSSWNARGGVGILRSTDGGQTWQVINRGNGVSDLYVGSLVMHPTNPKILLAGCGNNAASTYSAGGEIRYTGGVFRTADGGNKWTQTLKNDIITSVEFSPSNPELAYAGGRQRFYRSEDGGRTWQIVSGHHYPWGPPGVIAGFPIDILVDPVDPNTLFANNYGGGNVMSRDGGKTWSIASQGYTGALMFDLSLHPENPDIVYASARSGLFKTTNAGLKWEGLSHPPARLPETYSVALNPKAPQIVIASQELGGMIYRSRDGGNTWQAAFRLPLNAQDPVDAHGFKRIVFAPSAPHVVYAGACRGSNQLLTHPNSLGIYKSMQGGIAGSWHEANSPQTSDKSVNDLAVHPKNHNIVYAATVKGLFKTTDGGKKWTLLQSLQKADVRAVALAPSKPNTVYAGIQHGGILHSSDGGANWHKISAGMDPNEPVWSIVVNPVNPGEIWAGSQRSGVFRWDSIEQQWIKVNKGLRTRAVVDLEISQNGQILYAATTGEGVFRYQKRP